MLRRFNDHCRGHALRLLPGEKRALNIGVERQLQQQQQQQQRHELTDAASSDNDTGTATSTSTIETRSTLLNSCCKRAIWRIFADLNYFIRIFLLY